MSADNMPPLESTHPLWQAIFRWEEKAAPADKEAEAIEAEVRDYARAYAAEQTRELVEALQSAVDAWSGDGPPVVLDTLRAIIAKHKGAA